VEKILGLLTVNKVKPKDMAKKENTPVTNVHGSMEVQDILKQVESIENEKNESQKQKEKKKQDKDNEKELFYKCKSK
jgi:hypothetical protein